MACLFCKSDRLKASAYEDTLFNNKTFSYNRCTNCGLVILDPLPGLDDYIAMYPTTYQGELQTKPAGIYNHIIELIAKYGKGNKILDYGCGGGRFLKELRSGGFELSGTEFSGQLIEKLKAAFPEITFETVDNFLKQDVPKYDVIFISNVLEHLTNPIEVMEVLKKRMNKGGIIIAEGPLEEQFNLAYLSRKIYFKLKKTLGKKAYHPPYHIFRANYDNQLMFFNQLGLECLYYNCSESPWPYPSKLSDTTSMVKKIQYYLAKGSIIVSRKQKKWGNQFLYVGRL